MWARPSRTSRGFPYRSITIAACSCSTMRERSCRWPLAITDPTHSISKSAHPVPSSSSRKATGATTAMPGSSPSTSRTPLSPERERPLRQQLPSQEDTHLWVSKPRPESVLLALDLVQPSNTSSSRNSLAAKVIHAHQRRRWLQRYPSISPSKCAEKRIVESSFQPRMNGFARCPLPKVESSR